MAQARFKVGDVVRWTGIAARLFCDETAIVVGVSPAKNGIGLMDEYAVRTSSGRFGTYYAGELESVFPPQRSSKDQSVSPS
jgi:hypothetical protein